MRTKNVLGGSTGSAFIPEGTGGKHRRFRGGCSGSDMCPARSDPAGPPPSVGNGFALMCWRRLDVFCGLLAALPPVGHQSSCTADGACSAVVSLPDWLMGWGAIMQPTHLLTQPRKDMSPMQPMLC